MFCEGAEASLELGASGKGLLPRTRAPKLLCILSFLNSFPGIIKHPKNGTPQNDPHYYNREAKGLLGGSNFLDPLQPKP